MCSWKTMFDCLDTFLAWDLGYSDLHVVHPAKFRNWSLVRCKVWSLLYIFGALLKSDQRCWTLSSKKALRTRSSTSCKAGKYPICSTIRRWILSWKTIFGTTTHPAILVWLCIILLLQQLLLPRILHLLEFVSQLSQHSPHWSTGRCTPTHGLHHTTKTTPINCDHSLWTTPDMLPIQPCWNVAFPCTTLRIWTKRGSPNHVDDTTLSLRTWRARNPFHCCGWYPSHRVRSSDPNERRNTYESVRSKPQQRTTEEDGGMGDRDTTTQHTRIMNQNGRTHPLRCLSPSAIQTSSCVPCGNILCIAVRSATDRFAPPVWCLQRRSRQITLPNFAPAAWSRCQLRFSTEQLCVDRLRYTFTFCIFFTSGTFCGNPDPCGALHDGPSKQTAIVFSGEALLTGSPHASRSPTCPTDARILCPILKLGKKKTKIHPVNPLLLLERFDMLHVHNTNPWTSPPPHLHEPPFQSKLLKCHNVASNRFRASQWSNNALLLRDQYKKNTYWCKCRRTSRLSSHWLSFVSITKERGWRQHSPSSVRLTLGQFLHLFSTLPPTINQRTSALLMRLAHAIFHPSIHIERVRITRKDTQTCSASQSFNSDPKETARTCLRHYIHWLAMAHIRRRQRTPTTTPSSYKLTTKVHLQNCLRNTRLPSLPPHENVNVRLSFPFDSRIWVPCFFPSSKLRVTFCHVTSLQRRSFRKDTRFISTEWTYTHANFANSFSQTDGSVIVSSMLACVQSPPSIHTICDGNYAMTVLLHLVSKWWKIDQTYRHGVIQTHASA